MEKDDIPVCADGYKRLFSANINGLRGKINQIRTLCAAYKPTIFAVQETKIGPKLDSGEFFIDGYRLFRKDRNTNGGGIAIYAHESVNPRPHLQSEISPEIRPIWKPNLNMYM